MPNILKTGISKAFWCSIDGGIAEFRPAKFKIQKGNKEVSWFDELFEGGIHLPEEYTDSEKISKPLTFLITGPPGSGKTTLALELCYRLANNDEKNDDNLFSLYISTDAETDRVINNAISFGWENADHCLIPIDEPSSELRKVPIVTVWGRDKFQKDLESFDKISDIFEASITKLNLWVAELKPGNILDYFRRKEKMDILTGKQRVFPDILVIDSLNIVEPDEQASLFQQFVSASSKGTKIVIFVLNSGSNRQEHKFWEYFCDVIIRMDYENIFEYFIRTIEIVKARYQSHIWGKHQLKIYGKSPFTERSGPRGGKKKIGKHNLEMRRAHPYRKEGGIFIFPSIHFYLSLYKRRSASVKPSYVKTFPKELNTVLKMPDGRCTAFIGDRGGHKSHLGFLHILYRLLEDDNESGLIISLREDEGVTNKTLNLIMEQEFPKGGGIHKFEKEDRLEVLYYPPGYITPEEFFHRMFISIHRLKSRPGCKNLTVLFNSLDQLSARFPLCTKQEIFIPGMIETLSGEGITSIFIGVEEPDQPTEQYGLLPMADLILSFNLRRFPVLDYYHQLNETRNFENSDDEILKRRAMRIWNEYSQRNETYHETIVLQVVRFAGGERAGARGILELIDNEKKSLYPKKGLFFTPLSEKFSQGEWL